MKFSGSDWLRRQGYELSELGELVADVLGQVSAGIYHMSDLDLRATNWLSNRIIRVRWTGHLSNVDDDRLSRLWVLAADNSLRIEIQPRSRWTLEIRFSRRLRGTESVMTHIPTLEQIVERARLLSLDPAGGET